MKKLLVFALILTTLSSIGTACFALQPRNYFDDLVTQLNNLLNTHRFIEFSATICVSQGELNELFDTAWSNDPDQHSKATWGLRHLTSVSRENVGCEPYYARELIQHIIDAVDIIHQQNPLY